MCMSLAMTKAIAWRDLTWLPRGRSVMTTDVQLNLLKVRLIYALRTR